MSGPFEKYVEQAAEAGWNSKLPTYWLDEAKQTWSEVPEWKDADENDKQYARQTTLAALAAVGPLIQEDARERMVAAAGAALERDGCGDQAKIEAACKATAEYIVSEIERCAGVLVAESDDKGSFLTAAVLEKAASIARVAGGLS